MTPSLYRFRMGRFCEGNERISIFMLSWSREFVLLSLSCNGTYLPDRSPRKLFSISREIALVRAADLKSPSLGVSLRSGVSFECF